jgi:hypothetical protein
MDCRSNLLGQILWSNLLVKSFSQKNPSFKSFGQIFRPPPAVAPQIRTLNAHRFHSTSGQTIHLTSGKTIHLTSGKTIHLTSGQTIHFLTSGQTIHWTRVCGRPQIRDQLASTHRFSLGDSAAPGPPGGENSGGENSGGENSGGENSGGGGGGFAGFLGRMTALLVRERGGG